MYRLSTVLFSALFLLVACSDDAQPAIDTSANKADASVASDGQVSAGDTQLPSGDTLPTSACGPGIYPCGPYGSKVGDVISNLTFEGVFDPDHLCKTAAATTLDKKAKLRPISLRDFHQGSAACPKKKKKLLWVFVAAGWCHACEGQMHSLVPLFNQGQLDERVGLLNVLFQDDSSQPPTEAFARTWLDRHNQTYPLALDPKFTTKKYFPINATPLNFLVDLETMKIVYAINGANINGIGQEIFKHLSK